MTREKFLDSALWKAIVWPTGIGNVIALSLEFVKILLAHSAAGVSLSMAVLFCWIDAIFAVQGYLRRDAMLLWCMAASGVVSAGIICLVLHYR